MRALFAGRAPPFRKGSFGTGCFGVTSSYGSGRAGRFADDLLDEIRSRTDIVAVIGEYVQLRRRGNNFVGLCPFHQEKTPSFTVTPDKQMFYCFGCQTGGNVFTFLMKREGLSFAEAVEQLAARAGVALPERAAWTPAARAAEDRHRQEIQLLYRVLDFASRYWHQALVKRPEAAAARAYLGRRGLKPESLKTFRLGYSFESWDALLKVLKSKGVDEATLERAGLVVRGREAAAPYYDRFRGRLMFTISDPRGRPIGFGARALADGVEPKYLNSPETPVFSKGRVLYGLHLAAPAIRRAGMAIVVEGYMDAIACHEYGFDYTVASMGTAFTPEQARLLRRLTDTVVTAFDADTAGTLATIRGLEVLTAAGFKVKVAEIPGGKDPDECLRSVGPGATEDSAAGGLAGAGAAGAGREAFQRAVDEAVPLVEYRFRLTCRRHDLSTIQGRVDAVSEILPVLAGVQNRLELQEYLRDFARRLRVPEEALRAEFARFLRSAGPGEAGSRRGGVRDSIERLRNNKELAPGLGSAGSLAGSLRKQVLDAERTLLGYMVRSEENLHLVLTELLEAADWRRRLGLEEAGSGAGGGGTPGEEAGAQEAGTPGEEAGAEEGGIPGEGGAEAEGAEAPDGEATGGPGLLGPAFGPVTGAPGGDLGVDFVPPATPAVEAAGEAAAGTPEAEAAAAREEAAASVEGEGATEAETQVLSWFLEPAHRRIARAVLRLTRYQTVEPAKLIDSLTGERDAEIAARIVFDVQNVGAGAGQTVAEQVVKDCVGVLKEHRLNSRIEELHRRISDLERRGVGFEREHAELLKALVELKRQSDYGAGHCKVPGD